MKLHTDMTGLVSIEFGPWCLHLFPRRVHWVWGFEDGWYDGPIPTWGLGPLFRLICFWPDAWCKKHQAYQPDCCKPEPFHHVCTDGLAITTESGPYCGACEAVLSPSDPEKT